MRLGDFVGKKGKDKAVAFNEPPLFQVLPHWYLMGIVQCAPVLLLCLIKW
jgi:hypothetical protein